MVSFLMAAYSTMKSLVMTSTEVEVPGLFVYIAGTILKQLVSSTVRYLIQVELTRQLYVGVYPVNSGSPSVTGLLYDRSTLALTCTSTGGPATNVTWRKNGAVVEVDGSTYHQSQRVVDTRTATYENILSSSDNTSLVGNFTCTVSNTRSSGDQSTFLAGKQFLMDFCIILFSFT